MRVKVLKEAGYEEALLGLSLSFNSEPSHRVAMSLAHKGEGHSKFLESMMVWIDIDAPRYWWQQFDTYRVGTTKQSESTMHTIMRKPFTKAMFEGDIPRGPIDVLNMYRKGKDFDTVKTLLPESFLQRRVVCTNYKTLQAMEKQRRTHKLKEWQVFLDAMLTSLEHTKFIK